MSTLHSAEIITNDSLLGIKGITHSLDSIYEIGDTVIINISGWYLERQTGFYCDAVTDGYYTYSLFWPSLARKTFPCIDHPADRATCTLIMDIPENYTAACGGILTDSSAHTTIPEHTTWRFRYVREVCPYNISFTVGDYNIIDTMTLDGALPVRSFVFPSDSADGYYDFTRIPEIIYVWDSIFGDYPFSTVGCVETPMTVWGGAGGMEHQTLPNIGSYLITGTRSYETVVAHELAHQWFGDCIGIADWADFWLNEGIAVYSEALWTEYFHGKPAGLDYISDEESYYRTWVSSHGDFPVYNPESFLSPVPYNKGACWWNMLRWMMGDEDFFSFLDYYYERYKYKIIVTDSLLLALEDFTSLDWDWYLDQWIYQMGYPKYRFRHYISCDSLGWHADINIWQEQVLPNCTLFTNPIPIEIHSEDSIWRVTISPESRYYWARIPLADTVDFLWYDPDDIICGTFQYSVDNIHEQRFPEAIAISAYPNPFNSSITISLDFESESPELLSTIEIFDVNGRRVSTNRPSATSGTGPSGLHKGGNNVSPLAKGGQGVSFIWQPAASLGSGVYLVRVEREGRVCTMPAVYIK